MAGQPLLQYLGAFPTVLITGPAAPPAPWPIAALPPFVLPFVPIAAPVSSSGDRLPPASVARAAAAAAAAAAARNFSAASSAAAAASAENLVVTVFANQLAVPVQVAACPARVTACKGSRA